MNRATRLVDALLENDPLPDEVDPEKYIHHHAAELEREKAEDEASGDVTPRTALTASEFYHRTARNSTGALRVRRNGATKTWKTRPTEFKIPVKYGLYGYGYITDKNAAEWSTHAPAPPAPPPKPPKPPKAPKPSPVKPTHRQMVFNWRYMRPTAEAIVDTLIL